MLFHRQAGLPPLCSNGFHAAPPDLPLDQIDQSDHAETQAQWQQNVICVSAASANVQSLYKGEEGYPGKLQYLRTQFKDLNINFLGIQEARSEQVCSGAEDVLRLASGSDRGHHGVELWININCPIGHCKVQAQYLLRQDCVVVHVHPRLLLVRFLHSQFRGLIAVAHAPQSGCPRDQRAQWWQHFSEVLDHHRIEGESVILLLDANAAAGPQEFRWTT